VRCGETDGERENNNKIPPKKTRKNQAFLISVCPKKCGTYSVEGGGGVVHRNTLLRLIKYRFYPIFG
jgi:hypothetical protein